MSVLLDTTVLVDVIRGVQPVRERLRALGDDALLSAVTLEEIRYGMRPEERRVTRHLLDALEVVPVGRDEAIISGAWRQEFAARGITLFQADTLIAACAVTRRVPLATANVRDFPMAGLTVERW